MYMGGGAETRVCPCITGRHFFEIADGELFRRYHRGSLEQLPQLILKLTEEIQELKTSNSALIKNIKSKGKDLPGSLDLPPLDSRLAALLPESQLLRGLISHYVGLYYTLCQHSNKGLTCDRGLDLCICIADRLHRCAPTHLRRRGGSTAAAEFRTR